MKGPEICGDTVDNDCNAQIDEPQGCLMCAEVTADAFETEAFGVWASTLKHAQRLGFVGTEAAQLCTAASPGITSATARLINPAASAPNDTVILIYSERDTFAFLFKVDANGTPILFNEVGGVRMPPGGPVVVVGADGTTPMTRPNRHID